MKKIFYFHLVLVFSGIFIFPLSYLIAAETINLTLINSTDRLLNVHASHDAVQGSCEAMAKGEVCRLKVRVEVGNLQIYQPCFLLFSSFHGLIGNQSRQTHACIDFAMHRHWLDQHPGSYTYYTGESSIRMSAFKPIEVRVGSEGFIYSIDNNEHVEIKGELKYSNIDLFASESLDYQITFK